MLTLATIVFMVIVISPSYAQEPDKKSVKARENLKEEQKDVVKAQRDLKEAQEDSITEYQKFKREAEMKISDNEKDIADLKVLHSKMNAKENATYQKKVSDLEQKNNSLKKKLTSYKKDDVNSTWVAFRNEFNSDLSKLGKALKDFMEDSK